MHDLRAMGEGNALAGRQRPRGARRLIDRAAEIYHQSEFGDMTGRITATFEMIFLTGWAPDESQPQTPAPRDRPLPGWPMPLGQPKRR